MRAKGLLPSYVAVASSPACHCPGEGKVAGMAWQEEKHALLPAMLPCMQEARWAKSQCLLMEEDVFSILLPSHLPPSPSSTSLLLPSFPVPKHIGKGQAGRQRKRLSAGTGRSLFSVQCAGFEKVRSPPAAGERYRQGNAMQNTVCLRGR